MWSQVQLVSGAPDAGRPLVQDVSVDLRRADIAMAEELLHGTDVAAGLEQVGGERVPQSMARGALRDPGAPHGVHDGALQRGLVEVVPPPLTGLPVDIDTGGGENPLPGSLAAGVGVLPGQCPRQLDPARTMLEVTVVLPLDDFQMRGQVGNHDPG